MGKIPNEEADSFGPRYSVNLSPHLHNKLEQHIKKVMALEKMKGKVKTTKQKWFLDAVKDKLDRQLASREIPKAHRLSICFDPKTFEKLENQVNFNKNFASSYSKKQFIMEAVLEKFEEEAEDVDKLLSEKKEKVNI